MAMPAEQSMELPLLYEIEKAGGLAEPKDLYDLVAKHFPLLTNEDRKLATKTGANLFSNRVQFARNSLRKKQELDGSVYGIWKITGKGKERLVREWVGFTPQYGQKRRLNHPMVVNAPKEPKPDEPNGRRGGGKEIEYAPVTRHPGEVPIDEQVLARVQALTPEQFEHLVGAFLRARGLSKVVVTTHSHDGGIDGHCEVQFVHVKIGFQAKRFTSGQSVGAPIMQQFKGSLTYGGHDRGVFVTTSNFTPGAIEVAEGPGAPVVLVDGKALVKAMLDMGLGIRVIPVTRFEIDDAFFDALIGKKSP